MHDDFGLRYINCGDWVESCTAVVEHHDGTLRDRHLDTNRVTARRCRAAMRRWRRTAGRPDAHPGRDRCLASAGQRRGAHPGQRRARGRALGAERELSDAGRVPHVAAAELSGDPAGVAAPRRRRAAASTAYGRTPSISPPKGRSAMSCARDCLQRGLPFTTSFHTRFPDYLAARAAGAGALDLRVPGLAAPLPQCRRRRSWRRRRRSAGTRRARLPQRDALAARRRCRPVPPAPARRARPAAAGLPDRRPPGGREKPRGLSQPRSARHQGRGRRRAGARRRSRGRFPTRCSSARAHGEALAGNLCRRRRLRVSEPHRHVRPGAARGAGERRAGRRLSGGGAARRHRRAPVGVLDEDLRRACLEALGISPRTTAAISRSA